MTLVELFNKKITNCLHLIALGHIIAPMISDTQPYCFRATLSDQVKLIARRRGVVVPLTPVRLFGTGRVVCRKLFNLN